MTEIVLPGNKIIEEPMRLPGTYVMGSATYASVVGIYDKEHKQFIPLEGLWQPKENDRVIGKIASKHLGSYIVDLDSPYKGIIITKFEHARLETGDIIEATVREFKELDDAMVVMLTRPKKLYGGLLLEIKPSKVLRVIGRGNTMINQITEYTKSTIIVGLNGTIWIKGGNVSLASEAVKVVEQEAHISGLTEKIKHMLEEKSGANNRSQKEGA